MKVAVAVSNGYVSGPGEGDEVWIVEYNNDGSYRIVSRYENPAKRATMVRGVHMLKSALENGVEAVIVSEMGPPAFRFAAQRGLKVYMFDGPVDEALRLFAEGRLKEADQPRHGHHGHHHGGFMDEEVYDALSQFMRDGLVIADLGCGTGRYCDFFKEYASKLYCVDIDPEALSEVKRRLGGLSNVAILNEDVAHTSIPDASVDIAFMSNVLHDIDDKEAAAREMYRILKPGGLAIIVEFKKNAPMGPPFKLSPSEVEEYFNKYGFVKEQYLEVTPFHYMLVFRKAK